MLKMLGNASFLLIPLLVTVVLCVNRSVVYYGNWDAYNGYTVDSIPADYITHLIYAFANLDMEGNAFLSDPQVDILNPVTSSAIKPNSTVAVKRLLRPKSAVVNSSLSTPTTTGPVSNTTSSDDLQGNLAQLFTLKKKYRSMKTLLSFGGWNAGTANFSAVAGDASLRDHFTQSAVQMMEDYGFDGVDIDWEYPQTDVDANNYLLLLKSIRASLNDRSAATSATYLLSIAGAAGLAQLQYLTPYLAEISQQVDFCNVLAYDFAGDFSPVTAHASNFRTAENLTTPFSVSAALDEYISNNVPWSKLVLGCPAYGHSFCHTDGFGFGFSPCPEATGGVFGVGGTVSYENLPLPNALPEYSSDLIAAWSEDASTQQIISYENVQSIGDKIRASNCSGVAWWRAATDKVGDESLIKTAFQAMEDLDLVQNNLEYPSSNFSLVNPGGNTSVSTSAFDQKGTTTSSSVQNVTSAPTSAGTTASAGNSESQTTVQASSASTSAKRTDTTSAASDWTTFTIIEILPSTTRTIISTALNWTSHVISITEISPSFTTTIYTLAPGAEPSTTSQFSSQTTDSTSISAATKTTSTTSSLLLTKSSSLTSASTSLCSCQ